MIAIFLKETHPQKCRARSHLKGGGDSQAAQPLLDETGAEPSYGSATTDTDAAQDIHPPRLRDLKINVWLLIFATAILSFHVMSFVQLFPIFLQIPRDRAVSDHWIGGVGGLGRSLQHVGLVMFVEGLIGLLVQGVGFPLVTSQIGLRSSLLINTTLHPIAYFVLPYIAFLSSSRWQDVAIYIWLTAKTTWTFLAYPPILILLKRATPSPLLLGRVNGLVTSLVAASRTISPPVVGALQKVGEERHFTALPWLVSGLVGILGAVEAWFIESSHEG